MAANDDSSLSDDLIDEALEAFHTELQHWQIVGPLAERRPNLPDREFWKAIRRNQKGETALVISSEPVQIDKEINLQDKSYAVACVQWHGMQAALEAIRSKIG